MWCSCGWSHSQVPIYKVICTIPFHLNSKPYVIFLQPLCDGSHNYEHVAPTTKLKPVKIVPKEDKEVWLCMCKQTENKPFCDGSHRQQEILDRYKWMFREEFEDVDPRLNFKKMKRQAKLEQKREQRRKEQEGK